MKTIIQTTVLAAGALGTALNAEAGFNEIDVSGRAPVQVRCETVPGKAASLLPPGKKWKLAWHDEFDQKEIDRTKWMCREAFWGRDFPAFAHDFEGVEMTGETVKLNLFCENGQFSSPHLQTGSLTYDIPKDCKGAWPFGRYRKALFMHRYGYYEIRCRQPKYPGWHSAFWLQAPGVGSCDDPGWCGVETDIMENYRQHSDGKIVGGNGWNGYGHDSRWFGHFSWNYETLEDGWCYYGVDWSPKGYTFYANGKKIGEQNEPVSHVPQFILVSTEPRGYRNAPGNDGGLTAGQTTWGKPDPRLFDAKLPDAFEVDFVRVYDEVPATEAEAPRAVLELPPGPGNTRNSEGDFMFLKDGRVLFAYSKFIGGRGDDHDQCVIAARTSADKGESWSGDRIVATNELVAGGNVMSVSLLRLRDGRIALFYGCKLTTPEGLRYSVKLMRTSSDEGGTWGPAKDVTAGFPKSYRVLNNARVVRLKSGRILVPMADHGAFGTPDRPFSNHARMVCGYSDDDGASWKTSACVDRGAAEAEKGATFQEPGVVELEDGRVLMYFRTNLKRQYYAYSSDGGATWGAAEPSPLVSPLSPATIRRLGTGELVAFWNDHENRPDLAAGGPGWASGVRTPLTVGLSTDGGRTWPWRRRLETGYDPKAPMRYWYCYTAVLELDDRLLVAYCAEKNLQHLRITSIPLAWFRTKGE